MLVNPLSYHCSGLSWCSLDCNSTPATLCHGESYLQAEEATVVGRSDAGRRLEPLAGLPQQVAQRPHGRDGDGAGAAGQDQNVVVPPAHILQWVVLLLVCVQVRWQRGRDERAKVIVIVFNVGLLLFFKGS